MSRIEVSFKSLVGGGDKFFGADNTRIGKITGSIAKTVDASDFKLLFTFFFHYLFFSDPALTDFRAVHRTGFIKVAAISSQPLFAEKVGFQCH